VVDVFVVVRGVVVVVVAKSTNLPALLKFHAFNFRFPSSTSLSKLYFLFEQTFASENKWSGGHYENLIGAHHFCFSPLE
jgi:hypothetical protein